MPAPLEVVLGSGVGRRLLRLAGLPEPVELRRGGQLIDPIKLAALTGSSLGSATLTQLGLPHTVALPDDQEARREYPEPVGALVIDASGLERLEQTEAIRAVLRPALRQLKPSGRIVLLGPQGGKSVASSAAVATLSGIIRTVAKEARGGATANLIEVSASITARSLAPTLSFLLSGRSAFVSGQCWRVGESTQDEQKGPKVVVVTGAAQGIGAQIAQVAARDGAIVVAIDVPAAGQALTALTNRIRGHALQLDVTDPQAGTMIAALVAERFGPIGCYAIVHNAGITRDKLLVNTDSGRWSEVLQVNLEAPLQITAALLDGRAGGLRDGGRIIAISSTSGIAGNRGQANYAASKAGVIGMVTALARDLTGRGITANAVAPGFIQTEMTAKIPALQREIFKRTSSLGQAGLPIDVAETISYLLEPANSGVNGQVIRVCGQNLVGR